MDANTPTRLDTSCQAIKKKPKTRNKLILLELLVSKSHR